MAKQFKISEQKHRGGERGQERVGTLFKSLSVQLKDRDNGEMVKIMYVHLDGSVQRCLYV